MPPCGSAYIAVLHAVAVNGAYESSPAIVADVLMACLRQAAAQGAHTVALTALATGYGRMPMCDFATALRGIIGKTFPPLERVTVGLRSAYDVEDLLAMVPGLEATRMAN